MIQTITYQSELQQLTLVVNSTANKSTIILPDSIDKSAAFDLIINFTYPVQLIRDHDFNWKKIKNFVATEYSPKILKLTNGLMVQPNCMLGIWYIEASNPMVLKWRFNPADSAPITSYESPNNTRKIINANNRPLFQISLTLLFSFVNAVEFSRSKIPFTAIACFTDHCDFDTQENLVVQRQFFKKANIKVSKGIFLNHFSKRTSNASFEFDGEELLKWREEGHELVYHSLTQSILPKVESISIFNNFKQPVKDMPVWIDHGYQPYNLSLYLTTEITSEMFANKMQSTGISILWNYIDTGIAASGVINQLNSDDFTLSQFWKATAKKSLRSRLSMMIKNIIFHFYSDEQMILTYKRTASNVKRLVYQKHLPSFGPLFKNLITLIIPLMRILFFWKKLKGRSYKFANYSPLFFNHNIGGYDFTIFQTLEMVDFKDGLSENNISKLIDEKGVFIAHTYFSVPLDYHEGKLFIRPNVIDSVVAENFINLGKRIQRAEIWNPTVGELAAFLTNFKNIVIDIDAEGIIFVSQSCGIPNRIVQ